MAAGAAPAPQKNLETKDETAEKPQPQTQSLKERIARRLHQILEGHQEHLGWRQ
jgi:hypothetical protein